MHVEFFVEEPSAQAFLMAFVPQLLATDITFKIHPFQGKRDLLKALGNRLAIEELEAWFLGDVAALCAAFPGVPPTLGDRAAFRDPDAVAGGTAEALLRVLAKAGHYSTVLPKIEVARRIALHLDPERNRSRSFQHFVNGLRALSSP